MSFIYLLQAFFDNGGLALYLIALTAFMLWFLIFERLLLFIFLLMKLVLAN
ncbi:MAG: hypothetical protein JKY14_10300 [Paraglaciecola sp.]|nr:hypothetical protein [Paraglaciecola sp.]